MRRYDGWIHYLISMKKIPIIFFLFIFLNVLGISLKDIDRLHLNGCSLENFDILDTTELVVRYDLNYLQDTTGKMLSRFDVLIFQIGSKYTKFYGLKSYMIDLSYTKRLKGELWTEADKKQFRLAGDGVVDYEIIHNINNRNLLSQHHIPFKENYVIQYSEEVPMLKWRVTQKSKSILGYDCWLATTTFSGRRWLAWYTPSIPCQLGPWKMSGLPGLILELEDDQRQFIFSAVEIIQTSEPIKYYKRPTLEWTKHKWQAFDKKAHLSPLATFGQNRQIDFYRADMSTKTLAPLDDTWTIPYNPIELE